MTLSGLNLDSFDLEPGFLFGGPLDAVTPPSPDPSLDHHWMLEAFRTSMSGIGISNPNPAVGCVIVDSKGTEISRGFTHRFGDIHAERDALLQVQDINRLQDATLYVTLEPCSHQGNQPPCVDLILSSPIRRVVISQTDPNPTVNGTGIQKLIVAGKEVHVGIYAQETTAWNFPFFIQQILKRPCIALKWAQTLDGQLADDSQTSQWITGPTARAYTHWLRQRYDAILVGARTLLTDLPQLTARDCREPRQHSPLPIIFDPKGICFGPDFGPDTGTLLSHRKAVVVTAESTLLKHSSSWVCTQKNILILTIPGKHLGKELKNVMTRPELSSFLGRPFQSVLVEGGPQTLSLFLQENAADILHVFVAPLLTGGQKNRISQKPPQNLLHAAHRYHLAATSQLGQDCVMELIQKL